MILRDISFENPHENILFDDFLLYLAETGQSNEVLRFWESPKIFIVLGKIANPQEDLKIDNILREEIPVLRRSSGGGTVVQGKGCLNFSLILSKQENPEIAFLKKSYEFILRKIIQTLKILNVNAVFRPISDLALAHNEKKFSGNAQKRGKNFILHHGTILYDFSFDVVEKYLTVPVEIPEYRRGRSHSDFLTNIRIVPENLKMATASVFGANDKKLDLTTEEQKMFSQFLEEKKALVYVNLVEKKEEYV